jgi:hypothetical protein
VPKRGLFSSQNTLTEQGRQEEQGRKSRIGRTEQEEQSALGRLAANTSPVAYY